MTDTCLSVLKRWIPDLNEEELNLAPGVKLPSLSLEGEIEEPWFPSLKDMPISGYVSDILMAKFASVSFRWPSTPSGKITQEAYMLYFFAQLFKSAEEIFPEELKRFINPYREPNFSGIPGDDRKFSPSEEYLGRNSLLWAKLTQYGFDPSNLEKEYHEKRILAGLPSFKKDLLDIYGFSELTPTSTAVYVEFMPLRPFEEISLKAIYPHFTTRLKRQNITSGIFEMPLESFPGIDISHFKPGKILAHQRICENHERREKPFRAGPVTCAFTLKPQITAEHQVEFDETLRSLAKDRSFLRAIKSAKALAESS